MNPTIGSDKSLQASTADASVSFTSSESQALEALRNRYHENRDLFAERELARLRFLRWLYETGRVAS